LRGVIGKPQTRSLIAALALAALISAALGANALAGKGGGKGKGGEKSEKRFYSVAYTGFAVRDSTQTCGSQTIHTVETYQWNLHSQPKDRVLATPHGVDAGVSADTMTGSQTLKVVTEDSAGPEFSGETLSEGPGVIQAQLTDGNEGTDRKHPIAAEDINYDWAGIEYALLRMNLKRLKRSYEIIVDGSTPVPDESGVGCTITGTQTVSAAWELNQVKRTQED
jgi:hypothetical protein